MSISLPEASVGVNRIGMINIIPVDALSYASKFPVIEVTDAEYQEFLVLKKRIGELQDIFYERSQDALNSEG